MGFYFDKDSFITKWIPDSHKHLWIPTFLCFSPWNFGKHEIVFESARFFFFFGGILYSCQGSARPGHCVQRLKSKFAPEHNFTQSKVLQAWCWMFHKGCSSWCVPLEFSYACLCWAFLQIWCSICSWSERANKVCTGSCGSPPVSPG